MITFYIENDGDDDANLWTVLDDKGHAYFSSRDYNEAAKYKEEVEMHSNAPEMQTELIETEILAADLEAPDLVYP